MIEIDENGKEWFGYTIGGGERKNPESVVNAFTGNMHYLEWFVRNQEARGRFPLAKQIRFLFEQLPVECVNAITDDRENLIRELVRLRNRYAHGLYEDEAPAIERLQVLSVKGKRLVFPSGACADVGLTMS